MSDYAIDRVALATAERLDDQFGPWLANSVDDALRATRRDEALGIRHFWDPALTGIAGVIIGLTSFAWTVYRDLRPRSDARDPKVLANEVRVAIYIHGTILDEDEELVLDVVVDEVIRCADEHSDERQEG
jgi:hypothetical protein